MNLRATDINVDSTEAVYEEIDQIRPLEQMVNSKTAGMKQVSPLRFLKKVCYVAIVLVLSLHC